MPMKKLLGLVASIAVCATAQMVELNDGDAHGDAPYLIEDGWKPLLTDHGVKGWHGHLFRFGRFRGAGVNLGPE